MLTLPCLSLAVALAANTSVARAPSAGAAASAAMSVNVTMRRAMRVLPRWACTACSRNFERGHCTARGASRQCAMLRTPTKGNALLVAEDDRQTGFVAEHDHFRVGTLGQFVRDLDGFPLQQLGADPTRHDRLEVGDALGLHALALGFLTLAVEHEAHALRLLLGLQLFLDGGRQQWR